jgi:hypothetical protein
MGRKSFLIIILLGIILSIMIPTGQTPDEYSHLNMMILIIKIITPKD